VRASTDEIAPPDFEENPMKHERPDLRRREVIAAAAASLLPLRSFAQSAETTYPERNIIVYCAFAAGGPTDIAMRSLADAVSKILPRRVLVENKPGAGGALAAQQMAQTAKPDGYTLSQTALGVFRLPHMTKTTFDPLNDLTWILNVAGYEFGTMVRSDAPWKTWQEFIAYAKANPGKINYASPGIGTSLHLTMDDIAAREKIQWTQVPFKGTAESITALRGGHVNAVAGTPAWELIEPGTLRLLTSWGPNRNRRSPNVPTLRELYGIVANSPWGIAGPKGMDPRVVRVVHDTFRKALSDTTFVQTLDRVGMEVYYMAGDEYTKWRRETAAFEKAAVERLGLQLK
jgi:tripartite-type tricarboxylate transporter receptor subunit TctC